MSWVRVVAMVAVAGIALAGCGTADQPAGSAPVAAEAAGGEPVAAKVPEQLLFTAKTVDGKDFSGESLAGKPALLWFWTPWCPRCQGEAEDIAAAAKEHGDRVSFVGVAAQDQVPAMQRFVEKYGLGSFPHIADTDAAVWKRFGVLEQPAHAFIWPDGTVELARGQLTTDELLMRVAALAR